MKRLAIFFIVVAGLAGLVGYAFAQTTGGGVAGFKCIGDQTSHLCLDGITTGLRGNTGSTASFVTVAGYFEPGDGGGGADVGSRIDQLRRDRNAARVDGDSVDLRR